jgi:hypothetical protein
MAEEIVVMSKVFMQVPLTEIQAKCPCCEEALILSVRVAGKELAVGLTSEKMRATQQAIVRAVDGSRLVDLEMPQ